MHLGNGIICPVTGISMLAATGTAAFLACHRAKKDFTKEKIFTTVSLTVFVFALQMINFSIPQTGSSGHIIGAMLLALLLGPYAAFLAMSAIILTQALFFADGGLIALRCNIFNMGFLACFIAYPFIYKTLEEKNKPFLGAFLASLAAVQMASITVVLEGFLSGTIGLSSLANFTGLMQAIHLPIGIAEGFITGLIAILYNKIESKKLSLVFTSLALLFAGVISQYASSKPDGLEWSLLNISDGLVENTQGILYNLTSLIQTKTAILCELSSTGNVIGIFIVGIIMYLICNFTAKKTLKTDAR